MKHLPPLFSGSLNSFLVSAKRVLFFFPTYSMGAWGGPPGWRSFLRVLVHETPSPTVFRVSELVPGVS